ncbi:MAG: FecR domain-containing protein [Candidatus Omnitrophota bacterium]
MKKISASFLAFFLILSAPSVFAQMPLGAPATPAVAPVFEKIGVIAAAQGRIELKIPGQIGRVARSGQAVFMGDEITTDEEGHLQILFLDQTVFTLGPNSTIIINEFVYDPKSHEGAMRTSITKGVFRYVSGKIAAKRPNGVMVKLPVANLGFRGTIVGGQVNQDGSALVALLGPGKNNDAGEKIGSFVINGTGAHASAQQEVNRTGFGVRVGANGDLSGVFQLSQTDVSNLTAGLAPSGAQSEETGGSSATDRSGEETALTGRTSDAVNTLGDLSDSNEDTTDTAAQYSANSSNTVANGITTMEQLTRITTGIYHFFATGTYVPTSGSSGTMKAWCDIDFGSKTIGGGNSRIEITQGGSTDRTQSGETGAKNFSNMSGPAVFNWNDVKGNYGTFNKIELTLSNNNEVTADQATVKTTYTPTSPGYGPASGSGSASGARSDGPSAAAVSNSFSESTGNNISG